MTNPLHGCLLKLKRAEEHRKAFGREVEEFFLHGDAYSITLEPDPKTGKDRVLIEPKRPLPGLRWGTIVGDCVHNLRSALDQMVWVLTCAEGNVPPAFPLERGDKWKRIGFPIYDGAPFRDGFGNALPWTPERRPEGLWGVNEVFLTTFDKLQPYQHGPDARRQALWVLNELWSIDKHRTINVISVATERVVLSLLPEHGSTFTFEGRVRFEDGAYLGEVPTGWVDVDVQPKIGFRTFFAEGQPFDTMPVLETLGVLHEAVTDVLKGADYAFPILYPKGSH